MSYKKVDTDIGVKILNETLNVDTQYNQTLDWLFRSELYKNEKIPISIAAFRYDDAYLNALYGPPDVGPYNIYALNMACEIGVNPDSFKFFNDNNIPLHKVIVARSCYSDKQVAYLKKLNLLNHSVSIDYYEVQTYFFHRYFFTKNNKSYNGHNAKTDFRFVYGKLVNKPERLVLTQRLYEEGLLDNTYSGCLTDDDYTLSACLAAKETYEKLYGRPLSIDTLFENIKNFGGSPDNVPYEKISVALKNKKFFTNHCPSYPYNSQLYTDSKFSVIPETYYFKKYRRGIAAADVVGSNIELDWPIFITEKTYKAICNMHPFVIAGTPFILKNLKKRGYYTFSDYIDESYDTETDNAKRMEKIIIATKQMMSCKDHNGLKEIVEHNYKNFCYRGFKAIKEINKKTYELIKNNWQLPKYIV